jgi:rhamnogalacturonan endolyase
VNSYATCLTLCFAAAALASSAPDGFVLVKGGPVRAGAPDTRVDDVEICDHPVTNGEYKVFVDATRHAPPVHWVQGSAPVGMEKFPVVFVNRFDVQDYTRWRTTTEKRVYRLPTQSEFEYAARAGQSGAVFPWGTDAAEGRANYDPNGERNLGQWRKYLKPVKSYKPNPVGLFDMAGNVFQMVDSYPEAATAGSTYRIESPADREAGFGGGSWARVEHYLRCGAFSSSSSGIRSPELGFRLVREPKDSATFRPQPRRVAAAPAGGGAVFLSWQLLPSDKPDTGFHIYRSTRRDAAGERITSDPIRASTNYMDRAAPRGRTYYRVRPVAPDGKEGQPSERAAVNPQNERSGLIATFEATPTRGGADPIFGDLEGDGALNAVLRLDNGITETSKDPGVPVEIEAFGSGGRFLWRKELVRHDKCFGNAHNVPVLIHDLDGDGKGEVIARYQEGETVYLAVLDGMTGRVLRKTPWTKMVSDFARSSTRIGLAIAYLDGKTPSIITQTGLYENEVIDAYDANLHKLWQWRSFAETNGGGGHYIVVADLDGDGRDELLVGATALNPDGRVRWSIYRQHPDTVAVKHILPGTAGRQVFYGVERPLDAGVYLVNANTGKLLWKHNRDDDPRWDHAHYGWVSKLWEGAPGMQIMASYNAGSNPEEVLLSADGKVLMEPFPAGWRPINWTGGPVRDLINGNGTKLARFTGKALEPLTVPAPNEKGSGSCVITGDLAGDYRDEVVCTSKTERGNPAVFVYTNTEPVQRRELTRTANREYALWVARNLGGGYGSYFEWEP